MSPLENKLISALRDMVDIAPDSDQKDTAIEALEFAEIIRKLENVKK